MLHFLKPCFPFLTIVFVSSAIGQETIQSDAGQSGKAKNKKISLKYVSLAFTNHHSAFPFSSFSRLAAGEFHPGFELGTGFNWSERKKHDWFQDFRVGYFYHQFIQHGIPMYTQFGYRYKFNHRWQAHTALGGGYFHSIPAHERFKADENGEYQALKSVGRPQAMVAFNIGAGYRMGKNDKRSKEIFIGYQQRLQTPYVPSYVPLLPYNSLILGCKFFNQ